MSLHASNLYAFFRMPSAPDLRGLGDGLDFFEGISTIELALLHALANGLHPILGFVFNQAAPQLPFRQGVNLR